MPALPRFRPLARFVGWSVFAAATLLPLSSFAQQRGAGQLPQTRLYAVHPAGGQRGTSVDLTLADGYDLDDADHLYFSHPGITAVRKMQIVDGKSQVVAGQFTVTVAPEVPVGVYDIRVHGRYGLSNPRTFAVGDHKEVLETEPNNTADKATAIDLETVVNGRSDAAADVDWYKISVKAGQRILASLQSRRIDSRMDGALELHQGGRRLAHQQLRGRTEPMIDFTAPADGEYLLKVHDFVYGGGPEYFYRLSVQTGPYIDFILPASGQPNASGLFTLFGRNLPGGQPSAFRGADGRELEQLAMQIATIADPAALLPADQIAPQEAGVDGVSFALSTPAGTSNPKTIYFASAATALELEPNDTAESAQKLTVPVEITGQFQVRGDLDLYEFEAKSGAVFWIEVFGQRNGTSADPVLVIDQVKKNDKGQETLSRVTALDDNPVNIGGLTFNTTSDDPVFRFVAPADGSYRVAVRDRAFENRGDPSLVYRLSIRRERPDFRLVVLPPFPTVDPNLAQNTWELALRKGDNIDMSVMVYRRDGFAGSIDVSAEGLPPGVTCTGASISPNQNVTRLVLSSSEQAADWHGSIRVMGRARVDDPAAVVAENAAVAARTTAVGTLPPLIKATADTAAALKTATDQAGAAKDAHEKAPDDAAAKQARANADAALAKAEATAKTAADAKAAADAKVADAGAAVAAARAARSQAAREVTHEARSGTIVWNGNPGAQQPAQARMARSITLSVVREVAPYQLVTDISRVTVNQGSQILLPVKLLKRAGFDNNVNLTFVTPPQNVQIENKPINKGVSEQVYRVFVQNNAPVGIHTLFVQSQAQISYSKNPEAAAAAAKEKEEADKLAAEAADAAKKGAEAKVAADKKAADLLAEAKKAVDARPAAEKLAIDTAAAQKVAAEEKVKSDRSASDAATIAKAAADEKSKADKFASDTAATATTAADAAAAAKAALDSDPENETLKKARADADVAATRAAEEARKSAEARLVLEKSASAAADAARKAADAKAAADKHAADADEAARKAAEAKVAAEKAVVDTEAASKRAAEEKAAAEKVAADTDQVSKNAVARKTASTKKATDAANAAKPQNINTFFPATAIVLEIKPAAGTLAVSAAGGGALKREAQIEVKVTITRTNGFSGPVTLSLPLPPGVVGLSAPEVTIPADKNEGTLVIAASGEATTGQLANMVIRASMDFDGAASIDQPLALTVQQ